MSEHTQYRLAYLPVRVDRGVMEGVAKEVLETDILVLEAMYGEGAIVRLDVAEHGNGGSAVVTPAGEWDRLSTRYGVVPETNTTWCQQVYASLRTGLMENVLKAAAGETPAIIAAGRGKVTALAERQSAHARQVPTAIDPHDDGTQGEVEGKVSPTHKDQLIATLESRELKVRVRDTVSHLETMCTLVDEIEALGAAPAPGADLEGLSHQLAGLQAAADLEDDPGTDAQDALEAAASA